MSKSVFLRYNAPGWIEWCGVIDETLKLFFEGLSGF